MADIAVAQTDYDNGGSVTTKSCSLSNTVAGGVLHVVVGCADGQTVTGVTDSPQANAYSQIGPDLVDATNGRRLTHWYAKNIVGGVSANVITAAFSASTAIAHIAVKEIRNAANSAPDKETGQLQTAPGTATDGVTSGATATLSTQPALVSGWSFQSGSSGGSLAAGTGFTSDIAGSDSFGESGKYWRGESKRVTATTGVAATYTGGNDVRTLTMVAVFDELVAGSGGKSNILLLGAR